MADVHSKETRSYNMSRIKSKNTKLERVVRRFNELNSTLKLKSVSWQKENFGQEMN